VKDLQMQLIEKISSLLQKDLSETDVQLLDMLNRLLGTVSAHLVATEKSA